MRRVEITFQFTECVPVSSSFTCVLCSFLNKKFVYNIWIIIKQEHRSQKSSI